MPRRLRTILVIASSILCIATLALMTRSRRRADQFVFVTASSTFLEFTSRSGNLYFDVVRNWPGDCAGYYTGNADPWFGPAYMPSSGLNWQWDGLGIQWISGSFSIPTINGKALIQPEGEVWPGNHIGPLSWPTGRGFDLRVPASLAAIVLSLPPMARTVG